MSGQFVWLFAVILEFDLTFMYRYLIGAIECFWIILNTYLIRFFPNWAYVQS